MCFQIIHYLLIITSHLWLCKTNSFISDFSDQHHHINVTIIFQSQYKMLYDRVPVILSVKYSIV